MKIFKVIIFLIIFMNIAYGNDNIAMIEVQKMFETRVKPNGEMIFTEVPRGLIVSIDEDVFFKTGREKIRLDGTCILNEIADILNETGKVCVIEGHTENVKPEISCYKSNWELSLARANNITIYLMRCAKVNPEKLFSIGYGEFMPFKSNVSDKAAMNNRIDFVILDYRTKR